jgi:hypothetical protein
MGVSTIIKNWLDINSDIRDIFQEIKKELLQEILVEVEEYIQNGFDNSDIHNGQCHKNKSHDLTEINIKINSIESALNDKLAAINGRLDKLENRCGEVEEKILDFHKCNDYEKAIYKLDEFSTFINKEVTDIKDFNKDITKELTSLRTELYNTLQQTSENYFGDALVGQLQQRECGDIEMRNKLSAMQNMFNKDHKALMKLIKTFDTYRSYTIDMLNTIDIFDLNELQVQSEVEVEQSF